MIKPCLFLFSGGVERDQCQQMGLKRFKYNIDDWNQEKEKNEAADILFTLRTSNKVCTKFTKKALEQHLELRVWAGLECCRCAFLLLLWTSYKSIINSSRFSLNWTIRSITIWIKTTSKSTTKTLEHHPRTLFSCLYRCRQTCICLGDTSLEIIIGEELRHGSKDSIGFINPFHSTGFFLYPWKQQKTRGFLMFSGGIERDQWHEIG